MEVAELLSLLGIENTEDLTIDTVKDQIATNYVPRKLIKEDSDVLKFSKSLVGKRLGEAETAVRRTYKTMFGESVTLEDGAKLEDVLGKINDAYTEKVTALEDLANNTDAEQYITQIDQLKNSLQEQKQFTANAEKAAQEKANEFESFKNNYQLDSAWGGVKSSLVFSDAANDLSKKGFWALVDDKYERRLPVDGEVSSEGFVLIDKETNARPKGANDYLTGLQVLQNEAKAAGILKVAGANDKAKIQDKRKVVEGDKKPGLPFLKEAEQHAEALSK